MDGYLRDVLVSDKTWGNISISGFICLSPGFRFISRSAENYRHCYSGRRTRKRDYRNKMLFYLIYFYNPLSHSSLSQWFLIVIFFTGVLRPFKREVGPCREIISAHS